MKKVKQKNKKIPLLQYLQDYRFNSILVKSFAIILTLLVLAFTVIIIAVSQKMNDIITDEVGIMSINALGKTRDRIDAVMKEVVQVSGQLSLDNDIREFLLPDTKVLFGRDQTLRVKDKIEMYSGVFNYIDSIYVYSHKSRYIVSDKGGGSLNEFGDLNWYENLIEREYEPARMISRDKQGLYPHLISYIQPLRLTQMQFLGGIIVNVDVGKVEELVVSSTKDSLESLIIVDNRNNIIFSSDENFLRKKIDKINMYKDINFLKEDGYQMINDGSQDILLTVASSNGFKWKYVSAVPLSAYEEYNAIIRGFYIKLFLACILFAVISSLCIAIYCYTPVKNILSLVKNPDMYEESFSGDTGLRKDEMHEILLNIVRNLYSNKQMQKEMNRYSDIINKAHLTALQAQISPHFLYNTLENIRWKAMEICNGDNEVSNSIVNLSELLRLSIESDQQIITIEEELRNTKLYLEILQLRYGDKLKVIWEIDESVIKYPIVKISLQPVVENAVYHGIKPLRRQGIVTIRAYKENDEVAIQVEDNGAGIDDETAKAINDDLYEKYILHEEHIGIRNVNQRLKLLMGNNARLEIESAESVGTTVTFRLPFRDDSGR